MSHVSLSLGSHVLQLLHKIHFSPAPSFREFILIPETGIPGIPVDPRMGYILGSDTQSGRKSAPKNTHGFSEHFWCSETLKNTKQTRLTHKSDMPLGPKMAPKWHQMDAKTAQQDYKLDLLHQIRAIPITDWAERTQFATFLAETHRLDLRKRCVNQKSD